LILTKICWASLLAIFLTNASGRPDLRLKRLAQRCFLPCNAKTRELYIHVHFSNALSCRDFEKKKDMWHWLTDVITHVLISYHE
jgi:hypothetical protein